VQAQLLVWIFLMRVMMVLASGFSYLISNSVSQNRYRDAARFNFETPLTQLVWLTSIVSVVLTYLLSYVIVPDLGGNSDLWWQLSTVITCGTLAGAIIPEFVKVFTSTESRHVREVVSSSREGGASLNILSGFVAGNFSAYWLGITIMGLMAIAYGVSTMGMGELMKAPAIFAFGLVAFGFLGMGPVTIAVDSYGPVTDNAQSIYELSLIEQIPNVKQELKRREHLQGHRQAGSHRHRGCRGHHDDLFDHHGADPRPHRRNGVSLHSAPPVPARAHHRWRGNLLVHRRVHPGRDHRCVPRGRVHQSQHPARGRDQGLGRG
jgi:K(+)-stimulated pyrophosphate-energized sodium pump